MERDRSLSALPLSRRQLLAAAGVAGAASALGTAPAAAGGGRGRLARSGAADATGRLPRRRVTVTCP
ncbi:twin-arginine translocation signal domain-containing protein [Streptomyces sp. NPDC048275]|uniref:twin-arginine translocation signal domain-containing protein n=1 Tax=Streptomyces sp. NPDC048275 TaxID=3155629 RepID=UPI0033D91135